MFNLFFITYILLRCRGIVKALQSKLNILIDVIGESNFMECQTEHSSISAQVALQI